MHRFEGFVLVVDSLAEDCSVVRAVTGSATILRYSAACGDFRLSSGMKDFGRFSNT